MQIIKNIYTKQKLTITNINGVYIKTKKNDLIYKFLKKMNMLNKKNKNFIIFSNKDKIKLPKIKILKPKMN